MDRLDRLILKAMPAPSLDDRLNENNPYIGKSLEELTDYLSFDNYRAPEMHTWGWSQFIHAMMAAPSNGCNSNMEVAYSDEDRRRINGEDYIEDQDSNGSSQDALKSDEHGR